MVYNFSKEFFKITPYLIYKIQNWVLSNPNMINPPDENDVRKMVNE